MWNSRRRTGRFVGWKISEDSRQILYIYCNLWYNITMKHTEMNETSNRELVTISRAEYEAMHAQLDAQRAELAEQNQKLDVKTAELAEQNQKLAAELAQALLQNRWLMEQLKLNKRKLFGSSSEQLDQMVMDKFAYLFNEAEAWDADSVEPAKKAEKKKPRKRRSGSIVDVIPEGTPVEVVEHPLPENERVCNICGSELVEIGVEIHRSLQMEPARFWVREDRYPTYACKNCEKETGEANVAPTPMEPTVIPGSFASPSAIAHLAVQKYVMYSPLYRLEQEFDRQGLKLSRQTMSNWLLKATEDWLQPIYDVLHQKLCKEKVLHGDETTLQVLHEKGKSATSKSYMWLYRTSETAEAPIVLYDYQPNRKAENAEQFLEGFSGWLHADGYQGYHRLPEQIRVVGCWAHARRKFDEALTAVGKGTAARLQTGRSPVLFCKAVPDGAGLCRTDSGRTICQASGAGKTGSGGSVGMGKWAEASNRAQICPGQGAALSSGAVALPGALSGGRQAGALQQPRRAQHQALCDGPEELLCSAIRRAVPRAAQSCTV